MAGNLLQQSKKDSKTYIKSGGFEEDITLTAPSGFSVQTTGFATKHHIKFESDGTSFNAKNAHICVDEEELTALGYPVRINDEVDLKGHIAVFKDSSGVDKTYIVNEQFPDETLGLIVCILGDRE